MINVTLKLGRDIKFTIHYMQNLILTGEEDTQLVPPTMSDEAVAQAWYRLLRTIGDPVDLCRPAVVSQTQAFLQYAIASPNVIDPCQHPCLQSLPQIFLKKAIISTFKAQKNIIVDKIKSRNS
jgi:hypothetical protein